MSLTPRQIASRLAEISEEDPLLFRPDLHVKFCHQFEKFLQMKNLLAIPGHRIVWRRGYVKYIFYRPDGEQFFIEDECDDDEVMYRSNHIFAEGLLAFWEEYGNGKI